MRVIHCNTRVYAREVCTHEYPYEQVVLRVPAGVNASKVTRISCAGITTRDFLSSSNRAVPYGYVVRRLVIIIIIIRIIRTNWMPCYKIQFTVFISLLYLEAF